MTDNAFITMIVVLTLVWGGFAALLTYAVRRESRKRKTEK
ncbi:MAG: MetS family NSS transporter small subunit [Bacteroidota bacterium]